MGEAIVSGGWDDLRAREVRFLQEAARRGPLHVLLWSDRAIERFEGQGPKFPQEERRYLLEAIRWVDRLTLLDDLEDPDALPEEFVSPGATWVVDQRSESEAKWAFCDARELSYHLLQEAELKGFPDAGCTVDKGADPERTKVLVTGCYDWFHSGHVRFFEEVAALGELYVVVGHDENIRLLKGQGHPMFPAEGRRYMVGAIRHVHEALISTGHGWLDAEPEIERIGPDIYAVNEDGDRPEKRAYCEAHGIEYRVLRRAPKQGLPKRQSTALRGF